MAPFKFMRIVNQSKVPIEHRSSPKGAYEIFRQHISIALGALRTSDHGAAVTHLTSSLHGSRPVNGIIRYIHMPHRLSTTLSFRAGAV
jgi:hypothetical protein